ncbi:ATPase [Aureococcus anophagefferens]|nr:ATPase [Aureococcus anophagefferens]
MVVGNPSNPTMIGQAEYAVEIDRLDFAYPQSLPTDEARMVLNGFSMQLKPGAGASSSAPTAAASRRC